MAQSEAALGVFDPLLHLSPFPEPRFDLHHVTVEVGDDEAVGVDGVGARPEHEGQLLGIDGPPPARSGVAADLIGVEADTAHDGPGTFGPAAGQVGTRRHLGAGHARSRPPGLFPNGSRRSPHRLVALGRDGEVLARKEFALLVMLARNCRRLLTHADMVRCVWGDPDIDKTEALRGLVTQGCARNAVREPNVHGS